MSDLDLTEAVEAAACVRYERVCSDRNDGPLPWHELSPIHQYAWREGVLAEVTAAAPLIGAQVRERVAQEIEAQADRFKESALSIGRGLLNDYDTGALDAAHIAAHIARGGAR